MRTLRILLLLTKTILAPYHHLIIQIVRISFYHYILGFYQYPLMCQQHSFTPTIAAI